MTSSQHPDPPKNRPEQAGSSHESLPAARAGLPGAEYPPVTSSLYKPVTIIPPGGHKYGPRRANLWSSFGYAFSGLWYALHSQRNARIHIVIAILAVLLGIVLQISPVEFAMVFVAITGVFIAEMVNTVFEATIDLAVQEYHPLAKIAKDVAAGAVLLNALLSLIIGLLVFGPHLLVWAMRLLVTGH